IEPDCYARVTRRSQTPRTRLSPFDVRGRVGDSVPSPGVTPGQSTLGLWYAERAFGWRPLAGALITCKEEPVSIKVGDRLPEGTLTEFYEQEAPGCSLGPNTFQVKDLAKGRRVVIFGLPGAFTPTCSAKHVPGYVAAHDRLLARGIDEIWCLSV